MRASALILAAVALALVPSGAYGQKATEMFIPIGQSPGLSGEVTYEGTIGMVDAGTRTIADSSGDWTATVTPRTRIWLDRSAIRQTNREGSFDDLVVGRLVEVKYDSRERVRSGPAEWIKVAIED